jgi:hypothetical protein
VDLDDNLQDLPAIKTSFSKKYERIPYLTLLKISVPYLALENFFFLT